MSDPDGAAPSAATTDPRETPEVLVQNREGVLVITLNRPQAKNAMTQTMARLIAAALDRRPGRRARLHREAAGRLDRQLSPGTAWIRACG